VGTTNFTDVEVDGSVTAEVFVGELQAPVQVLSANGAITIKSGVVLLTKADASAITLDIPDAGDDGRILTVISETAKAHTLTITGGLNGAGEGADVGTFGGAVGDYCRLVAYDGAWHSAGVLNVTFA